MRIAVVGNGPSALGKGADIDACDFVVRTGQFKKVFKKGSAGKCMDAWAWPGYAKNNNLVPKQRHFAIWVTCPWKWHKGAHRKQNVSRIAITRKLGVRAIPLERYLLVRHWVRHFSDRGKDLPPTTGLLAIAMAVRMEPESLLLCGFDAGKPYADGRAFSTGLHDYYAERKMLEALNRGVWLGDSCDIEIDWRTE